MKKQFVEYLGKQIPVPKIKTNKETPTHEDVHEDTLLAEQIPDTSNTSMTIEVPPAPVAAPTVAQTNPNVTDSILEGLVAMLNQILQELSAIHQKLDAQKTTTEETDTSPTERTFMLIRNEDDKIIGAKVVDVIK